MGDETPTSLVSQSGSMEGEMVALEDLEEEDIGEDESTMDPDAINEAMQRLAAGDSVADVEDPSRTASMLHELPPVAETATDAPQPTTVQSPIPEESPGGGEGDGSGDGSGEGAGEGGGSGEGEKKPEESHDEGGHGHGGGKKKKKKKKKGKKRR